MKENYSFYLDKWLMDAMIKKFPEMKRNRSLVVSYIFRKYLNNPELVYREIAREHHVQFMLYRQAAENVKETEAAQVTPAKTLAFEQELMTRE